MHREQYSSEPCARCGKALGHSYRWTPRGYMHESCVVEVLLDWDRLKKAEEARG